MLQIPSHHVVSLRRNRAFNKDVVVRVGTELKTNGWPHPIAPTPDRPQRRLDLGKGSAQAGTPDHFFVFGINIAADT
jgi:hypothetical protein